MELVIKESMRLFPPVPVIGRRLEEETRICMNNNVAFLFVMILIIFFNTADKYVIPADTNFTINLYLMFRDETKFPDPDAFRPERFEQFNTKDDSNAYDYIPFSAGSRNCIGQKFAMLEMKSTLSKMLLNFELLPAGELPIPLFELILRSQNGVQLAIQRRKFV